MNKEVTKIIPVSDIFRGDRYRIPIYQRNYAWQAPEIEQLIDDIVNAEGEYFLGNLIVNKIDVDSYEVIDGQQRLTTLYLLISFLGSQSVPLGHDALSFEAREKSNRTLSNLSNGGGLHGDEHYISVEIENGYKAIAAYFNSEVAIDKTAFEKKLDQIKLVRVQVPEKIDLNHYFEIMNTRGEQLEFHEIAKAKILGQLGSQGDKVIAAKVWEACSEMDSYVQMNFNPYERRKLFSRDWMNLKDNINSFAELRKALSSEGDKGSDSSRRTLLEILESDKKPEIEEASSGEEKKRFESIISFPNFLLQVNKLLADRKDLDKNLDDHKFLSNMEDNWKDRKSAEYFIVMLLITRTLFDRFIVKREFDEIHRDGKWSLQEIKKTKTVSRGRTSYSASYIGSFSESNNLIIRNLQASQRITYTAPRTMEWITRVLAHLINWGKPAELRSILESYAVNKIKEADYENSRGFGLERIVFTYLDYVLYRDGYSYKGKELIKKLDSGWEFQFRNSVEHFYPQNITLEAGLEKLDRQWLDSLGNLALVTVSSNSKFSNISPLGKTSFTSIINQSQKLMIMAEMVRGLNGSLDRYKTMIEDHEREMISLLNREVERVKGKSQ